MFVHSLSDTFVNFFESVLPDFVVILTFESFIFTLFKLFAFTFKEIDLFLGNFFKGFTFKMFSDTSLLAQSDFCIPFLHFLDLFFFRTKYLLGCGFAEIVL